MMFDVAIVGYGPVGATLANLLGLCGVSVCVFERERSVYHLPRAGHFDDEVMRVFQTIGLADEIAREAMVNRGMRFVNQYGELLINWPRPQKEGPQAWHPSWRFDQPTLETSLRRGVERYSNVRVRLGVEVERIETTPDGAALHTHVGVTRARWIVGCDGGRSLVRRVAEATLEDLGEHERWLVIDLELRQPVTGLDDFTVQLCDPRRPMTLARMVGMRRRWEIMLMPGDDPERIASPESVWSLLRPWTGPDRATIARAVVYTFHAMLAQGWRRGPLLLCGDSAHQSPPFLGQGLCAGIRDAANLAWKLAMVIRGRASNDLLDSYESERAPHVRAYIETAVRLGRLVQITDPDEARKRDALLSANPEVMRSIRPDLGPGLHGNLRDGGALSHQPWLPDGRRMDDAVGYRFAVVGDAEVLDAVSPETRAIWSAIGACVLPDLGADWLGELGARAAVIRPDRYLLGTAQDTAELEVTSRRIAGHIAARALA
jgi:3-(3-hydroxy-phenyl)propionate hydroxylase